VKSRVHAFSCAACSGTLTCDDHEPSVTCPFCETDNYLYGDDLPRSFFIEPVLDEARAVKIVRRETAARIVAAGFSRRLRIERRDLVFLPFNAVRAVRTGRIVVREEKQARASLTGGGTSLELSITAGVDRALEGDRPAAAPARDTRILFNEFLMHEPACDAGLGAEHVRFERNVFGREGRPLEPFNRGRIASRGAVLEPEIHPRVLRERLEEAGRDEADASRRIDIVGAQLFQIYYPVWIVRGTFEGRSHRFVVDAVDGILLGGRVPASRRHRAVVSTSALLLAAAPITLALRGTAWWLSPEGGGGLEAGGPVMLAIIAAGLLAAGGWGLMVMGWLTGTLLRSRELVFKAGLLAEEVVDLPASGPIESLAVRLLAAAEKLLSGGAEAARYG
jgi:hypothetical protein